MSSRIFLWSPPQARGATAMERTRAGTWLRSSSYRRSLLWSSGSRERLGWTQSRQQGHERNDTRESDQSRDRPRFVHTICVYLRLSAAHYFFHAPHFTFHVQKGLPPSSFRLRKGSAFLADDSEQLGVALQIVRPRIQRLEPTAAQRSDIAAGNELIAGPLGARGYGGRPRLVAAL